jgi:hypothetical protein
MPLSFILKKNCLSRGGRAQLAAAGRKKREIFSFRSKYSDIK